MSVTQNAINDTLAASALTGQVAVANGGTGASTAASARSNLGVAVSSMRFFFSTPANQTIVLDSYAEYAYTINEIDNLQVSSGSITATIQIGGTNVTGLSSLSVTSTPQSPTASGANSVSVGNRVTLVLSAASSPFNLEGSIKITI